MTISVAPDGGVLRFAGRRFRYESVHGPWPGYCGLVLMVDIATGKRVTARTDLVTIETPADLLADVRAKAAHRQSVDWAAVRRASAKPVGERSEDEQALVDAYAS